MTAMTSSATANAHQESLLATQSPSLGLNPNPNSDPSTLSNSIIFKEYYLFGHPISHSAAPYLHNLIWNLLYPDRRFSLYDTAGLSLDEIAAEITSNPRFAGAAVTMPLKVAVMGMQGVLHRLAPAAVATGAVNTIVTNRATGLRTGTNTDTLGIRHALFHRLSPCLPPTPAFEANVYASFIIGSGATTRSALYALDRLNLSPIYLINRDHDETLEVVAQFPHLDLRPIVDEDDFEAERSGPYARPIPLGVGCIPASPPSSPAEELVYRLARRFFVAPYKPPSPESSTEFILAPTRPIFLEMAYKPRRTSMLLNAQEAGWATIEGIEPMIEQGLAQSRMWIREDAEIETLFDQDGKRILDEEIEAQVREFIRGLGDL